MVTNSGLVSSSPQLKRGDAEYRVEWQFGCRTEIHTRSFERPNGSEADDHFMASNPSALSISSNRAGSAASPSSGISGPSVARRAVPLAARVRRLSADLGPLCGLLL